MPRVLLAVAVLTIVVYGLVDVIRTDRRLTRGISKPAWIVVMVVLPVIGAALWFIFGRPRGSRPAKQTFRHPTAPDDDPEFLRALELKRRKQAEADRQKKLNDQLDAREQKRGNGSDDSHNDAQGNDEVK